MGAYLYVDEADHYAGLSLEELGSIAREFARLQAALASLSEEAEKIAFVPLMNLRRDLAYDSVHLPTEYSELRSRYLNASRSYNRRDIPHGLLKNSDRIIEEAVGRLREAEYLWRTRNESKSIAAYVDFHPHNTLVREGNCILIYDFESCIPQLDQDASVAFALHRFTREWVIKTPDLGAEPSKEKVLEARDRFISAYEEGGGRLSIDFRRRLPALVRWMNLYKLLYIYRIFTAEKEEIAARKEPTLWEEMRKFIMYIQEADFYEDVA